MAVPWGAILSLVSSLMGSSMNKNQPPELPKAGGGAGATNMTPTSSIGALSASQGSTVGDAYKKTPIEEAQLAADSGTVGQAFSKSAPVTDPGGSTGGNPPFTGPDPGKDPYSQDFPVKPGPDDEYSLNSPWMYPTHESTMASATGGGGGGGGGGKGGGGGLPLSWLDKINLGSQIGGSVSGAMSKGPPPPGLPGGGAFRQIDPTTLMFLQALLRGR